MSKFSNFPDNSRIANLQKMNEKMNKRKESQGRNILMSEEIKKMKKKILVDYKVLEMELEEEMWDAVLYRLDIMKEKILNTIGVPEEKIHVEASEEERPYPYFHIIKRISTSYRKKS